MVAIGDQDLLQSFRPFDRPSVRERAGRIDRKLPVRRAPRAPPPYAAVYRVREQTIEIMKIYHAAQDRS
jgi:hypothetical protein